MPLACEDGGDLSSVGHKGDCDLAMIVSAVVLQGDRTNTVRWTDSTAME